MRAQKALLLLFACLGAGLAVRLAISLRTPVGYDEVFVMGLGLDEMVQSTRAFLIDTPLRRSNAGTPLWWWLQSVPALLTGRLSLWGLRVIPLILGAVALGGTFLIARARFGRGPAAILVFLVAFSDILVFSNARGEFAESLLMAAALPATCLIGSRKHTAAKGALAWLMLMTHLGKGLFLAGAIAMADAIAQSIRLRRPSAALRPILGLAVAGVVSCCWLAVATTLTTDGPIPSDIGPVAGPGDMLWKLTAGYAESKSHMVAAPLDAAQVWLDGWVWPATAISAVPLLVGLIAACRQLRGRRAALCLGVLPWIAIGLAAVVARGMVGARFHLLYLPAVWMAASVGLWRLRHCSRGWVLPIGILWAGYVFAVFSWSSWTEHLWRPVAAASIPAVGCAVIVISRWQVRPLASLIAAGFGVLVLGHVASAYGPFRWASFSRMEPFAARAELVAIDEHRANGTPLPGPSTYTRTLYIDLANYFLTADSPDRNPRRAAYYARLETQRTPNNAAAWFYLGEALHCAGAPADQVRSAWRRSYELQPLPIVRERLEKQAPADEPATDTTDNEGI